MRINGFEQIKAFYSWVFNEPEKARPTHISLYLFLLNQNNRANWVEWFKCPYDLAMHGARIGNKGTYYKCLTDLKNWNIIDYKKGQNNFKAPLIKLFVLYNNEQLTEQVTVPLPEPQSVPQSVPLPEPLTGKKYKLLTDNIKLITDNLENIIAIFLEDSFNFKKSLLDLGIEKQIVSDWLRVRSKKKATNSEIAFNHIKKEIEKSGLSANECIKKAVIKSWSGFEADWLNNSNAMNTTSTVDDFFKRKLKALENEENK